MLRRPRRSGSPTTPTSASRMGPVGSRTANDTSWNDVAPTVTVFAIRCPEVERVARRACQHFDVVPDGESKFSRFAIGQHRVQCPGVKKKVVGLSIDRHRDRERVALVPYGRAARRSIDLIGAAAESFDTIPLLTKLARDGEGHAPFTIRLHESPVSPGHDVGSAQQG